MAITPEQVKKDLETISTLNFKTLGPGSERDRAAQLVLQSLEVAYRRLDNPKALKLVYFDMGLKDKLPSTAVSILERYTRNEISKEIASPEFEDTITQYRRVFKDMGINPQEFTALFGSF